MTAKSKHSIAQQLHSAQLMIDNSLHDEEILGLVSGFGYTPEKLNAAQALFEAAQAAHLLQKSKAGAQQESTRQLVEAFESAQDAYRALAKVARAVFLRDQAKLSSLGLTGKKPDDLAGFLIAAMILFDNASGLDLLAGYGYDAERLGSERAKIAALDQANQRQEAAKGAAQQATLEREAAFQALHEWTSQYRKIASVALREKKELLEKIGFVTKPRGGRSVSKANAEGAFNG